MSATTPFAEDLDEAEKFYVKDLSTTVFAKVVVLVCMSVASGMAVFIVVLENSNSIVKGKLFDEIRSKTSLKWPSL